MGLGFRELAVKKKEREGEALGFSGGRSWYL
jgi:hypothetical protein